MKYATTATLLATIALTTAQSPSSVEPSPYSSPAEEACNPSNSSGLPDFNAPCNAVIAIEYQCIYGPDYLTAAQSSGPYNRLRRRQSSSSDDDSDDSDDDSLPEQNNSTQRTCICESQFFAQVQGCANCYSAHGSPQGIDDGLSDASALASLSSAYCAASATPTLGLADYLFDWADSYNASHPATATATASTMSDAIGNRTDVSLYFTPSVTGTAAWLIAEATSGASSGMGSFASENTSGGMIVPTASANNAAAASGAQTTGGASGSGASGASGSGASATSSAGGAVVTAAGVGMLGLAGLVAMLSAVVHFLSTVFQEPFLLIEHPSYAPPAPRLNAHPNKI
ncbi:hypothetical protein M409DRAFT_27534 [Zasmidium cellare ATCC 36951]|uniref:Uncharacterized protein n=1 Tax=Zasmidium cellare ATCC 36951 TaxID=1080233 RepID=A0A6A6C538_ZASCE|nr:uncharacterized protein M409DRAFT_27534 [Zasmidium cellare ATCC 36951]KAF2162151.1 hypothetical protein M409DRAFT_27534 [Zasmidium cellare ATCC 36951]